MEREPIYCADIGASCCGSCHEDEDLGFDNLWQESWLHACCFQVRVLSDAGIGLDDEDAIRAFVSNPRPLPVH